MRASASQTYGVPANPVEIRWPLLTTSSASRSPASASSSGESRSKTIASVYAVVQSERTVPSAATYSALNAARVRSASGANSDASWPSSAATSATIRAER